MSEFNNPVFSVILAGGLSRRMQGQDKGLLKVNNRSLIEFGIECISHQVDKILISANRNIPQYNKLGYPVLTDTFGEYAGPLAGILTALENIPEDSLLLVLPCDMPTLPHDLVAALKNQLMTEEADLCCVLQQQRLQPLVSIMHHRVQENLQQYLHKGQHKVQDWVQGLNFCTLPLTNESLFNINSPEDLIQFEEQAAHGK